LILGKQALFDELLTSGEGAQDVGLDLLIGGLALFHTFPEIQSVGDKFGKTIT
jgi:hypothetical protein